MILSFKEIFVPAIVAGTKPHSIRAGFRWRAGMSIQFYQGSYHQKRNKFRPDAVATSVQQVHFKLEIRVAPTADPIVLVDDRRLTPEERKGLAMRDGFSSYHELARFIDQLYGLPFTGQLIHWTDLRY